MESEPKPMKRYAVAVDGYTREKFDAHTPSAARYAAFKAFCEATTKIPFVEFLRRVHVIHLGEPHA